MLLYIKTTVYHNTTISLVQNLSKKKKVNKWDKNKKREQKKNKLKQNKERKTHTHTHTHIHTHTPVNYVKKKRQNMYKYLRSFLI